MDLPESTILRHLQKFPTSILACCRSILPPPPLSHLLNPAPSDTVFENMPLMPMDVDPVALNHVESKSPRELRAVVKEELKAHCPH